MIGSVAAAWLDRTRLAGLADALAVAVAAALPWSTSALGIFLVLWLLALIPTLDWPDIRRELMTAAGGLPVLLFALGVAGMAWADVGWDARWEGLDSFWKLLIIPLLMVQFRRSGNGHRVFLGFLVACTLLLVASFAVTVWPYLPRGSTDRGVAVKSYIIQSIEFTMCAAGLLYLAVDYWRGRRRALAVALALLGSAFLFDIFFIATGRTALVVIPVLVLVYGTWRFGGRGFVAAAGTVLVIAATVWASSPHLRNRVAGILTATERHEDLRDVTPSEQRLVYWAKSLGFIEDAPLIGHGTGSIEEMFTRSAVGQTGARGQAADNPHNQSFAVGIQLGLVGVMVLWAMWIAHFALFRAGGLVAWIGLVVVTQNVVGSLFNSFLFDYTEGWLYVFGFGVAAGMMRQQQAKGAGAPVAGPVRAP
jgi:O-antigen ligase